MSGRSMPFRSGDDAARAAVAPLLDELRGELLVLPREAVVEKHLDMMAFEERVLSTPRVVRPVRRVRNQPRRAAFVFGCIAATIASCGLSAAGALPEPLQHITDRIADTLGVPQPHDNGTSTGSAPLAVPETTAPPTDAPRSSAPDTKPQSTPDTEKRDKPRATTPAPTTTTPTSTPTTEPLDPPAFPARPNEPGGRVDPTEPTEPTTEPPSDNSQNTPAGYPTDWREQAIDVTSLRMLFCSMSDSIAPADCPQSVVAPGAENVTWRLLGDPTTTAAAVATTTRNAAGDSSTLVTVYERFRMLATYTLPATGATQYTAYSSGVAQATMAWTGSYFDNITMSTGSVDGHVMPGVTVPTFPRAETWDYVVAMKVLQAFDRCTGPADPGASCPPGGLLDSPTTNQSTVNNNVVADAEVSFDSRTGLYTVTGTYSLTPPSGAPVNGIYTATLFYEGSDLTILSITGR